MSSKGDEFASAKEPARPPIPEGVPDLLGTGDVMALLGCSYDQVRSLRRSGRLRSTQNWHAANHWYKPQWVEDFAAANGIPVYWQNVTGKPDTYA